MRKGLVILAVLLIVAVFAQYVMDKGPKTESVYKDAPQSAAKPSETPLSAVQTSPGKSKADEASKWELVWSDDFSGPYLDVERWTEIDRKDNYNNELQYYTPANSYVSDGCLTLTAKKEQKDGKSYTSAMVQSQNKCAFLYGRIEARMKTPIGKGFFPAFWLLPCEGTGEIDIMEAIGSEPNLFWGVVHYFENGGRQKEGDVIQLSNPDAFHVFALEWEPGELRWYVDGKLFFKTNRGVPQQAMYVIFTLAVGGDWPGSPNSSTVFPGSFSIDYVRYFRQRAFSMSPATPSATPIQTQVNTAQPTPPNPIATNITMPTGSIAPAPTTPDTPGPSQTEAPTPAATDTPVPTQTTEPTPNVTDTPEPTQTTEPTPNVTDTPEPTQPPEPTQTAEPTPPDTPGP